MDPPLVQVPQPWWPCPRSAAVHIWFQLADSWKDCDSPKSWTLVGHFQLRICYDFVMEELLQIFSLSKAIWTSTSFLKYMQSLEGRWSPGRSRGAGRHWFSPWSLSKRGNTGKQRKVFHRKKKKGGGTVNLHTWFLYPDALVRSHETNTSLRKQKPWRAHLLTGSVSCGHWTQDLQGGEVQTFPLLKKPLALL